MDHLSSCHVSILSYGPWIVYKVLFLQFCGDFSKKPWVYETIYVYPSKRSCYALSENDNCLLYTMAYCFGDSLKQRKFLIFKLLESHECLFRPYKQYHIVAPWCSCCHFKSERRFCVGLSPARGVSEIRNGEDLW